MDLGYLVDLYVNDGYEIIDATHKVAQDIILLKISKSSLNHNVTIKGGVVMHSISKNKRRATRDIDFDFIKYSLDDTSIKRFIEKLNNVNDGVGITIHGRIEELHHQDYDGKRVCIKLVDKSGFRIDTKLDIGVHKDFDIEQEEYCFDLGSLNTSVVLFINSKEQMFAEKLKSLMKFAYTSTRYKDIYDFYYLIKFSDFNKYKLDRYLTKMIFNDNTIRANNYDDIYMILNSIFSNRRFISNLKNIKVNWLGISALEVTSCILSYIREFDKVSL